MRLFKDNDPVEVVNCTCYSCSKSVDKKDTHDEEDKEFIGKVGKISYAGNYVYEVLFENGSKNKFYLTQLKKI